MEIETDRWLDGQGEILFPFNYNCHIQSLILIIDISNHQHINCAFNSFFRLISKKILKLQVVGPLWGKPTMPLPPPPLKKASNTITLACCLQNNITDIQNTIINLVTLIKQYNSHQWIDVIYKIVELEMKTIQLWNSCSPLFWENLLSCN